MDWLSTSQLTRNRWVYLGVGILFILTLLSVARSAMAAEVVSDEVYHLAQGDAVEDDLMVFAQEIVIDGTVDGDLIAFGQFVTVNGDVSGDVLAAGAEVQINGTVQDDVRVAGAAVTIRGRVADDLVMAAGGFGPGIGTLTIPMGGQSVTMGMYTGQNAVVGGDAYMAGGYANLEGLFRSDLFAAAGQLVFNAQVEGDAKLESDALTVGERANVAGEMTHTAPSESEDAGGNGGTTVNAPEEGSARAGRNPVAGFGWWLMRTILLLAGIVLLGMVLLALRRTLLTRPAGAIAQQPVMAGLYGVLAAVIAIPLSAAIVFLATIFFGWFWGAVASFAFCFGFLLLAWVLSPVVTGLWLGRLIFSWIDVDRGEPYALLVGASVIVLAGRILGAIPCTGVLAYLAIYMASFALAAGGVLITCMSTDPAPDSGSIVPV